jgi:UDP-perosamine 4-acetyltransferase
MTHDAQTQQYGLTLIGGGGHARVVVEAVRAMGGDVRAVFDDDPACAVPHDLDADRRTTVQALGDVPPETTDWILALGDLRLRADMLGRLADLGVAPPAGAIRHPSAVIATNSALAPGVFVAPLAVINPGADIGAHAIINSGAIVEHDARIGENTHVAPGAIIGGGVRVGSNTLVGLGAKVLPGVTIGDHAVIGAGAVVTGDVEDGTTVVGVPARPINATA